jgi:hypothetical protein
MSLNRRNPRRDDNEPEIAGRFTFHRWLYVPLSGAGIPDGLACPPAPMKTGTNNACLSLAVLVDVKKLGDGRVTEAQGKKWGALAKHGVPVYIARSAADVDAIVNGSAVPWGVMEASGTRWRKDCCCQMGTRVCEHDLLKRRGAPTTPKAAKPARRGQVTPRPSYTAPSGRRCANGCGNHGWDTNGRMWTCADCGQPPEPQPAPALAEETFAPRPRTHPCTTPGCGKPDPCAECESQERG